MAEHLYVYPCVSSTYDGTDGNSYNVSEIVTLASVNTWVFEIGKMLGEQVNTTPSDAELDLEFNRMWEVFELGDGRRAYRLRGFWTPERVFARQSLESQERTLAGEGGWRRKHWVKKNSSVNNS